MDEETKSMLLDLALALAIRALDAAGQTGVDGCYLTDQTMVSDKEWKIQASYSRPYDGVQVEGKLVNKDMGEVEENPLPYVFGQRQMPDTEDDFQWRIPSRWLHAIRDSQIGVT